MAYWLQRVLLTAFIISLVSTTSANSLTQGYTSDNGLDAHNVNTEYFEIGAHIGIINIQDFTSELSYGLSANFHASEDFFLQMNYFQAKASLSEVEENRFSFFPDDKRTFRHFDFLLGYNLFQGEVFFSRGKGTLSSLYLLAGIGDTDFGGEASFTYTLGVGYQMALTRQVILKFEFKDHFYSTSLIKENTTTHNTQISAGLSYLF